MPRSKFNGLVTMGTLLLQLMRLYSSVFGSFVYDIDINSLYLELFMLTLYLNIAFRCYFIKIGHEVIEAVGLQPHPFTTSAM